MKKIITCTFIILGIINSFGVAYSYGLGNPLMFSNFATPQSWDSDKQDEKQIPQGFDFGPYFRSVQSRIYRNWEPPENIKEDMTVVVKFKILKDGNIEECIILKSSGNTEFDKSAQNAIALSLPFKPLPEEFDEDDHINVQYTFNPKYQGVSRF